MMAEERVVGAEEDSPNPETFPKPVSDQKTWMPLGIMAILGLVLIQVIILSFLAVFFVLPRQGGLAFLASLVPFAVLLAFAYSIKKRWAIAWFALNLGALVFIGYSIYIFSTVVSLSAPDTIISELILLTFSLLGGVVMILYLLSEKPVEWFGLDPKWSRL